MNEIVLNKFQDIYDAAIEANKKSRLESFDKFGHIPDETKKSPLHDFLI